MKKKLILCFIAAATFCAGASAQTGAKTGTVQTAGTTDKTSQALVKMADLKIETRQLPLVKSILDKYYTKAISAEIRDQQLYNVLNDEQMLKYTSAIAAKL